jgi:hypothetical protein
MNLFWKRILGILRPTPVIEKQEYEFLTNAARYGAIRNSPAIASYRQLFLEVKLSSPSTRKAKQQKLKELGKHPDVKLYLSNIGGKLYGHRDVYLSFSDDFYPDNNKPGAWQTGFFFKNETMKRNYSFHNEQQANNSGNNTSIRNGVLQIHTRREACRAMAWHPRNGFVEKDFFYTSDILQNASVFSQRGGIFKAKIRCTGKVHHAVWLGGEQQQPHINIFHFNGKEVQMGYVNNNSGDGVSISGIDPSTYYIYSLEWTQHELIWSVNNIVVFRSTDTIPWESLFMKINSFIPLHDEGGEGLLEVDWIRAYQFNT